MMKILLFVVSLILCLCYTISSFLSIWRKNHIPNFTYTMDEVQKVTLRVNTYKRLDLLKTFLDNYQSCNVIEQIQIIWSDQDNQAPIEWLDKYPENKIIFEIHRNNSLSNRFKVLHEIKTEAVFSIDDDLVIPCDVIKRSMSVWASNTNVLVGYSPRMAVYDSVYGFTKYLKWQHTWWNGFYSIMLTKASIIHKKYLLDYHRLLPNDILNFIDEHRNCEDIAMAFLVAEMSKAAPVWIEGTLYETSTSGISSGSSHFNDRGQCLSIIRDSMKGIWPWITGYQKSISISYFDIGLLYSLSNKM